MFILTEHTPNRRVLKGVRQVFVAPDFFSMSREEVGPGWDRRRYQVIAALADHWESGVSAVATTACDPSAPSDDLMAVSGD